LRFLGKHFLSFVTFFWRLRAVRKVALGSV
jgi:hypothetical protein